MPKADATHFASEGPLRTQMAKAQALLKGMTLDQKLSQMLIVEYYGYDYQSTGLQQMVTQQYVGGYMYQFSNKNFYPPYDVAANLKAFSDQAQKDARIPLMIATDQEGGLVNRLDTFHGALPSAQVMAEQGNTQYSYQQAAQDAKWMRELGMNADLAPVVDVNTVPQDILQDRMFGSDPQTVDTYAGAFLDGLQQNNVIGCLKHFPGLGAITSDPHFSLPVVNRSKADLEKFDLAPYRMLIQQKQPAMIMPTDVLMPAIDPNLPAELSPKAINGVLRGELGYDGVVMTDELTMDGISAQWSLPQAAVLAVMAGDDLLEGPSTVDEVTSVIAALKQAIQDGRLSVARIDQSVTRILLMKMQYGIIH
ncbi:MAG TPA: glycoside hydrolase family 3 N-terminal domain-containing protein [Ktedonobacteraceae bacterium]|jgi:beta-N-acetylhexosaminidase|nr:glycoside hydrolase family 3 N-terminal domain-containing protein [Ktedonobacteraceae bacterium]